MATTTNIVMPLLSAAQSQKHVTHNDALIRLDAVVQLSVKDRDLTAPPGSPAEGDRYMPASGATGAWSDKDLNIVYYQDGSWQYVVPREGWLLWVEDEEILLIWTGAAWELFSDKAGLVTVAASNDGSLLLLGVNTAADSTNRLAVKSNAVLLSHDDVTPGTGDLRITVNKSAAGKDGSFILQDGFSTRALFGLLADDDFTLKVSPNGSSFFTALSVDKDTGHVGLNGFTADATNGLGVKGTAFLFDAETDDCRFTFNKAASGDDVALTFQSGYSARALVGLLGDNNFTFKVSTDGSSYKTAMIVYGASGRVSFEEHPKFSAYVNFDRYVAANTWTLIDNNSARHNDQGDWGLSLFTAPHDGYYLFGAGYRFKANSTVPTDIKVGLSVNAATPTADCIATSGDATIVTLQSFVQVTGLLKLTAGQTVSARAYMSTNDGYVEADSNFFWGCQVA